MDTRKDKKNDILNTLMERIALEEPKAALGMEKRRNVIDSASNDLIKQQDFITTLENQYQTYLKKELANQHSPLNKEMKAEINMSIKDDQDRIRNLESLIKQKENLSKNNLITLSGPDIIRFVAHRFTRS